MAPQNFTRVLQQLPHYCNGKAEDLELASHCPKSHWSNATKRNDKKSEDGDYPCQYKSSEKTAIDPNQKKMKRKIPKGTAGDSPAPMKPRMVKPTPDIDLRDLAAYMEIQEQGSTVIGIRDCPASEDLIPA